MTPVYSQLLQMSDMQRESDNSSSLDAEQPAEKPRENGHVLSDKNTNAPFKNNGLLPSFVRDNFKLETLKQQTKHLQNIDEHMSQDQMLENVNSEWRDISNVLDRLFLVLYLLIFIITTLAFLMQCVWSAGGLLSILHTLETLDCVRSQFTVSIGRNWFQEHNPSAVGILGHCRADGKFCEMESSVISCVRYVCALIVTS